MIVYRIAIPEFSRREFQIAASKTEYFDGADSAYSSHMQPEPSSDHVRHISGFPAG
jgi:hypothetical protein